MKAKPQDLIVCSHFKLVKKLGTGAFGQIYLAENKNNPSEKYAAKLEEVSSKFPQLHFEAKMYKYLSASNNVVGIPKVYAMTTEGQYNVMLMDLLGLSIEDIFVNNGKKMSLKSALMIGYQMLERIRYLHERQIIHRDIKPDNFLMGIGKNSHILYIVDFGLSKKYIKDNKHIPYKDGKDLTGTARYASINTHMGYEQSRRDDIESIGYVIMYLLRGVLPWQNMNAKDTKTKYKLIMEKKMATPAEVLCKGFPQQLSSFVNYARQLKFEEEPDYNYLLGLLKQAMKSQGLQFDYSYDWAKRQKENKTEEAVSKEPVKVERQSRPKFIESKQIEKPRIKVQKVEQKVKPPFADQNALKTKGNTISTGLNKSKQAINLDTVMANQKLIGPRVSVIKK